MTTITLYLYDERGVYTETIEHPIKAPIPPRWTKVAPPETQDGEWAVWDGKQWMVATEEPPFQEPVIPVPESVSALQGLLAVDRAGFAGQYEAWASDPIRTFAERAFISKAETWKRDDPTLLNAATALGISKNQLDELFILAVTL